VKGVSQKPPFLAFPTAVVYLKQVLKCISLYLGSFTSIGVNLEVQAPTSISL